MTFNQGVTGSNPVRPTSKSAGALDCHKIATFSDGLVAYRICAQAEGKSRRSIDWIIDIVGYFNEFLGNLNIEAVTADDLRRFIIALQQRQAFANHRFTKPQNRPLSSESITSYTRAIKTFFSFLEREELIADNPMKKVKLPKALKKSMPVFNEGDLGKLLAQPDKRSSAGYRNYVIMLTLLDTGIRVSELCNLKVSDVDLPNGHDQFEVNCSGLELVTGDAFQRVIIDHIYAGSPAEEAGLEVGDEIVQINGANVSDFQLPQIRSMLSQDGKEIEILIDREGELHNYIFILQPLIE